MSRPSRPCLPFLLKTGDNDVSVGAAFPDLAINGRAEIASTSFAVYRPRARNFVVPADGHRGTSVAVVLLHQRVTRLGDY